MARNTPQFPDISQRALDIAETLLPHWMGGKRIGHEWQAAKRADGGPGDSWNVNLNTGAWLHGASDKRGGDLVSLYAALHGVDNLTALNIVAPMVGWGSDSPPILPRRIPAAAAVPDDIFTPIPDGTPDPKPHHLHGKPTAIYRYGSAMWIYRYATAAGGKSFATHTWRNGALVARALPKNRPLYRLADILANPEATILLVEGEKCADAASAVIRGSVVTTWANGAESWRKTDFSPLAGRNVVMWPDADEPGRIAMGHLSEHLAPMVLSLRVADDTQAPEGWDVAEAIQSDNWTARDISNYIKTFTRVIKAAPTPAAAVSSTAEPSNEGSVIATVAPASRPLEVIEPQSALNIWNALGLDCNQGGMPHNTLSNASLIIQAHQDFAGKIWLDTFSDRIQHTLRGAVDNWTDRDARRVTTQIQQQLQLPKFNLQLIHEAVEHAADVNQRNSLQDWLNSLEWDGVDRLSTWLADCLGVDRSPYNDAIARNWPISMVARAMDPGCQVDTMPVLEGLMGRGKSSFLAILGGQWYASIGIQFGGPEFLKAIQGKWLIEIPDMAGFSRREHGEIISAITTRDDVFRASYGRNPENHKRKCVFSATSETDDYLQDTRGRRRYWPLRCTDIDLDALRQQREQVFAQALHEYTKGAPWHVMPDSAGDEQLARANRDVWADRVLNYAYEQRDANAPVIVSRILEVVVEMPFDRQDQAAKNRIVHILKSDGWLPSKKKDVRCYFKPKRE